ncbi:MAG: putative glycoside hydrolase, partial [Candidatus Falkowbacteria bacterium]|nr:putative glycoside hydrolase [Candidatus Falkowbacteria bacterium]
MKTLILMIFSLLAISQLKAQPMTEHYYLPTMGEYQALNAAKHSQAIIDLENIYNNPEMIDLIIQKNPDIKLILYWNLVEWFDPMFSDKPWSNKILTELKKRPGYWLKQANGQAVAFWPGMKMINLTGNCPKIQGKNYREFIIDKLKEVLADKRFKGIMIDNLWTNIDWLAHYGSNQSIDADLDGKPDNLGVLNTSFQREARLFVNDVRKLKGADYIIIANPGNLSCLDLINGKVFEGFPDQNLGDKTNDGWNINMAYADNGKNYNIFNARENNLFFTLCSAMLLDDVYVSYKQNEPW